MTDLLTAALAYAARGWPVFPCDPATKRPLLRNAPGEEGRGGVKKASTDPAQVTAWWRQWPRAMIGVSTGDAIGAFVLDLDAGIDPETGEVFTLERLRADVAAELGCALPATWTARTPRGGAHIYFALPAGEPMPGNRASLVKRVDVRGNGGYVILPPSVREDGVAYEWIARPSQTEIAPAPAPALDCILRRGRWSRQGGGALEGAPPPEKRTSGDLSGSGAAAVRKYALAALDAEVRACVSAAAGTRSDQLNRSAYALGQLVAAGALIEGVVQASLEGAARAWPNFPKSRGTIKSGLRAGKDQPRDLREIEAPAAERTARRFSSSPPPLPPDDGVPWNEGDGTLPDVPGGAGAPSIDDDGAEAPPEIAANRCIDPGALARCATERQNDTGNANRLLTHFGADLIFVRDVGWHVWDGTHFELEGGAEQALRHAQETAERIELEANHMSATPSEQRARDAAAHLTGKASEDLTEEDRALKQRADEAAAPLSKRQVVRRRFAVTSGNAGRVRAMLDMAAPKITLAPDDIDANPFAFNVANGTLHFLEEDDPECPDPDTKRTRWRVALRKHDRRDRIGKMAPVDYDPAAQCPKFASAIERFQPVVPVREFLCRYHGLALTGLTEQGFVFNHGLGANFKSTFIETIGQLMGAYAQTLQYASVAYEGFGRRGDQATPDIARLTGARMVRVGESKRGVNLDEALIKDLTSGEELTARALNKDFFRFRPVFKLAFGGNQKPEISGVDYGIWRRVWLIEWPEKILKSEQRPMAQMLAEYAAERSGILNWLIAGALDYLNGGLRVPDEVLAATEAYREEMDPVGNFIADCVEVLPADQNGSVSARELYAAFCAWCMTNAVRPWKERGFASVMTNKGFQRGRTKVTRMYVNIRLHDVPNIEAEISSSSADREFA